MIDPIEKATGMLMDIFYDARAKAGVPADVLREAANRVVQNIDLLIMMGLFDEAAFNRKINPDEIIRRVSASPHGSKVVIDTETGEIEITPPDEVVIGQSYSPEDFDTALKELVEREGEIDNDK